MRCRPTVTYELDLAAPLFHFSLPDGGAANSFQAKCVAVVEFSLTNNIKTLV